MKKIDISEALKMELNIPEHNIELFKTKARIPYDDVDNTEFEVCKRVGKNKYLIANNRYIIEVNLKTIQKYRIN